MALVLWLEVQRRGDSGWHTVEGRETDTRRETAAGNSACLIPGTQESDFK